MRKPIIIAHRGESYDAPENTLAAFNLAWKRGAEAVECDVHLSKDKHIIVIHDDNTLRTTGRNKPVGEQTAAELQSLDAGLWRTFTGDDIFIPTLEQVLKTIPPIGKLLIEIKCGIEIVPILKDLLSKHKVSNEQIILMDFNYNTAAAVKRAMPHNEVLWLSTMRQLKYLPMSTNTLIRKTRQAGLDGLNVLIQQKVNENMVEKIKNAGLKLYVWTVDDPITAKRLIDLGIDGIATNRPSWIKNQLQL